MESYNASDATTKLDRKTTERNRRIRMKSSILELISLVPQQFNPSKERLSPKDQLHRVTAYITQLRERVEKLKKMKEMLISKFNTSGIPGSGIPVVKITEIGSNLEVVLVTGLSKKFGLHEVILVLHGQGVEVVSISISTMADRIYHILHAQVKMPRIGVDTLIIYDRLQKLCLD
ncbi:unnamed protein product [Coffea canephora]|uniref:DH200=94 genomic scaffold, scaffold_6769 n=1 Tax=Coffea canephora TaxID=49390 RepID=A0A068VMG4_COFCA|nr:unnamed protein product [Coffea canephora]